MTKTFNVIPLILSMFLIVWTAAVYPFSKAGDKWAFYPALVVLPLTILAHGLLLAATRPKTRALLYALLHVPMQFVVWLGCLMLISKDSF